MSFTGTLNRVERGERYSGYTDLTVMCCPECGILYAIPETLRAEAKSQGGHKIEWCCPNGHNLGYPGESAVERAKQERDAARDRAAAARARAEQAEASAAAQKRAASRARNERNKARKRSADGVCPCCGRSFKQVRRHMANKHPDYDPAAA
jgi:hypothetical protein